VSLVGDGVKVSGAFKRLSGVGGFVGNATP
jgi:hypothetical protein